MEWNDDSLDMLDTAQIPKGTMGEYDLSLIRSEYPFKSNFMEIHNNFYHYIDEGEGDPILMVHGNPTWSFFFRHLISGLSQTHRCLVPDHIGCGLSSKPADYEYVLENHIDNLEAFVLKLDLQRITLVVHDWGGAIGMGCAIRQPHRFQRFVMMNTAAFSSSQMPWRIGLCRLPILGDFLIRRLNLFVKGAIRMAVSKPLSEVAKKGLMLPYNSYQNRIAVYRFVKDIPLQPLDYSYEILLQIEHGLWMFREKPTLLLWGMKDWCFTAKHFLSRWSQMFQDADICRLDSAGHYLLEDEPEKCLDIIQNFLEENEILE